MDWKQIVRERLAALRLPPERESEIVEELAPHLEAAYEDELAAGLSATEAEARAVQSYDWRLLECELSRAEQSLSVGAWQPPLEFIERRGGMRMESLLQDLRFGVRMLLKQPGFTGPSRAARCIDPRDEDVCKYSLSDVWRWRFGSHSCRTGEINFQNLENEVYYVLAMDMPRYI